MESNAGKTVAEILKGKKASIKDAALGPGSPSWSEILNMPWEEVEKGAKERKPGFKTINKLLTAKEYNK